MAVYSSLYYTGFVSDFGRGQFAEAAQMNLNGLIKDIEFYKLQHGAYPDSLKQLETKNTIVWDWDPIPGKGDGVKSHLFNYRKIGNKYELFSSGLDGIPYTKDDLYPQVATVDTSKFGLIIKRP